MIFARGLRPTTQSGAKKKAHAAKRTRTELDETIALLREQHDWLTDEDIDRDLGRRTAPKSQVRGAIPEDYYGNPFGSDSSNGFPHAPPQNLFQVFVNVRSSSKPNEALSNKLVLFDDSQPAWGCFGLDSF